MTAPLQVDREMARHLVDCANGSRGGLVTCTRDKLKRIFCLDQGHLIWAVSNVIEEQFAESLVLKGLVPKETMQGARDAAANGTAALTQMLVDQEVLGEEDLRQTLEDHVRQLLYSTLDWTAGDCALQRGRPDIENELTIQLDCKSLLVEYGSRHPAPLDQIRARVGPSVGSPMLRVERSEALTLLDADDAARHVVEACDGFRTLGEILGSSTAGKEETWRAVYSLILLGALDMQAGGQRRKLAADDPLSREEVTARISRTQELEHYGMLELLPGCSREDVREAYYFLARRYHPDRFRSGPLTDLLLDVESYFTRVTEAYNTLWDPAMRAEYDLARERQRGDGEEEQDSRYLARTNYLRGRDLVEKGRFTDAANYLSNALKLDPAQAKHHLELGKLLSGNPRRRAEAEELLIETNRIDPALVDGYLALARLYVRLGRKVEAQNLYDEVLRWEPGHVEAEAELNAVVSGKDLTDDDGGLLRGLFRS